MFGWIETNLWKMYREQHGSTSLQSALSPHNFDLISFVLIFETYIYSATNAKQLWTMFRKELEWAPEREKQRVNSLIEWEWNEIATSINKVVHSENICILFVISCDEGEESERERGRDTGGDRNIFDQMSWCVCVFAEKFILVYSLLTFLHIVRSSVCHFNSIFNYVI